MRLKEYVNSVSQLTENNHANREKVAGFAVRVVENAKIIRSGTDFRTAQPYAIVQMGGEVVRVWPNGVTSVNDQVKAAMGRISGEMPYKNDHAVSALAEALKNIVKYRKNADGEMEKIWKPHWLRY